MKITKWFTYDYFSSKMSIVKGSNTIKDLKIKLKNLLSLTLNVILSLYETPSLIIKGLSLSLLKSPVKTRKSH